MIYWCMVDPDRPEDLDVAIRNGLWGVPEEALDRIEPVEPGDGILFYHRDHGVLFCEVGSEPYTEKIPVWRDADYPHRVRISDPLETDRYAHLGQLHQCLHDPDDGEPYASPEEAEKALTGPDGVFRPLTDEEARCVFRSLGWQLPIDLAPDEEPDREGTAGEGTTEDPRPGTARDEEDATEEDVPSREDAAVQAAEDDEGEEEEASQEPGAEEGVSEEEADAEGEEPDAEARADGEPGAEEAEEEEPGEDEGGEPGAEEEVSEEEADVEGEEPDAEARAHGEPGAGESEEPPDRQEEEIATRPDRRDLLRIDVEGLREHLFGERELARCALCGRLFPVRLLAMVFVKDLSACTRAEARDVRNNVLPACRLGCEVLFREGFVVVEEGVVEPGRQGPLTEPVEDLLEAILGNRCEYWHSGSAGYFRWHARRARGGG